MSGIARLGDVCEGVCIYHGPQSGVIISASTDTFVNDMGIARLGDIVLADCGHEGTIVSASTDTLANGMGVARLGDSVDGDFVATIVSASTDAFAND